MGLKQDVARKCISDNPKKLLHFAANRKHSFKGAIYNVIPSKDESDLKKELDEDFMRL